MYEYYVSYSIFVNIMENGILSTTIKTPNKLRWCPSHINWLTEHIRRDHGSIVGSEKISIINFKLLEDDNITEDQEKQLTKQLPKDKNRVSDRED